MSLQQITFYPVGRSGPGGVGQVRLIGLSVSGNTFTQVTLQHIDPDAPELGVKGAVNVATHLEQFTSVQSSPIPVKLQNTDLDTLSRSVWPVRLHLQGHASYQAELQAGPGHTARRELTWISEEGQPLQLLRQHAHPATHSHTVLLRCEATERLIDAAGLAELIIHHPTYANGVPKAPARYPDRRQEGGGHVHWNGTQLDLGGLVLTLPLSVSRVAQARELLSGPGSLK